MAAIRGLTAIKDGDRLLGFRIISTTDGVGFVNLKQAEVLYEKTPFDNVEFNRETHRWRGTECSIDKLPIQDRNGNYIQRDAEVIIINKLVKDGITKGFTVMNLDGAVTRYSVKDTIAIARKYGLINAELVKSDIASKYGLINAELVKSDNGYYIRGKRKEIPVKVIKSAPKVNQTSPAATVKQGNLVNTTINPQVPKQQKDEVVSGGNKPNMDVKLKRMKELVPLLRRAAEVYEQGKDEIMSNYEYDKLYDELKKLEDETGVIMADSVTQKVGYTVQSKLAKVTHPTKMLSLNKTKNVDDLSASLGGQEGFLGWKLDGLTVVATYDGGKLVSAVTRGNGAIGEDVTENYKTFSNVPLSIEYKGRLVVRGEALISYKTFEEINRKIEKEEDKYKNPRNLASGSVRQLDTKITKARKVAFIVFTVVDGFDNLAKYTEKLEEVGKLGFEVVEYVKVTKDTTAKAVEWFSQKIDKNPYPTDGLVITIDNIAYGDMLGTTNKFPRNAKAFKWQDEVKETELLYVEWSNSRTGAINPVAVFKPVDLEGTTVERASVHNVSIVEQLQLGVGDTLQVFKANMIIPQVADNLTRSGTVEIPKQCPVCGGRTEIRVSEQAKVLFCTNPDCAAKHIGSLVHFVTRDAMNIDGLSESTLERFVNEGFVRDYKDIYHIEDHKDKIVKLDGFGKRSYAKLYDAIEKSRDVELSAFLYSLGVEQLGRTTSKIVCKAFDYDLETIITATIDELTKVDGVGDKTAKEIAKYFAQNADMVRELAKEMRFKAVAKVDKNSPIYGKTFCITGDVYNYKNRKELQAEIESLGGKAASSVSAKTDYLINNDVTSGSNKNQKAKELGIPIISEADYMKMIGKS